MQRRNRLKVYKMQQQSTTLTSLMRKSQQRLWKNKINYCIITSYSELHLSTFAVKYICPIQAIMSKSHEFGSHLVLTLSIENFVMRAYGY